MSENGPEKQGGGRVIFVFEAVMSVFYLVFGGILLFTRLFDGALYGNRILKLTVGILFAIYGIFRIHRSWRRIFARGEDKR
jgi:cytochrome b subunit of formate dehydrogenase